MIKRIKIGHQKQADKPVYLLATGVVQCGNFCYKGRYKSKFKSIFGRICELVDIKRITEEIDVSGYKYWDAVRIYDEYVVERWVSSVSARRLEKFANETEVFMLLEDIKVEFKRALALRWRRVFKKSDPKDPNTPKQAWKLL